MLKLLTRMRLFGYFFFTFVNSLVTKGQKIPSDVIYAGTPAHFIRENKDSEKMD